MRSSVDLYYLLIFFSQKVTHPRSVYIGRLRHSTETLEQRFMWTDQSEEDYVEWMASEPDQNPSPANCVGMNDDAYHKWMDMSCNVKRNFICKKLADVTDVTE